MHFSRKISIQSPYHIMNPKGKLMCVSQPKSVKDSCDISLI